MKTLTVHEATKNLVDLLQQAITGEEIGIRSGRMLAVLRPPPATAKEAQELSPREALRSL